MVCCYETLTSYLPHTRMNHDCLCREFLAQRSAGFKLAGAFLWSNVEKGRARALVILDYTCFTSMIGHI